MTRPARKLKVYRTSAGFYDAYVAAPSQKAAIEAWGADPNTFARGNAEVVTDPALTAEPLARPGEVIRKKRGSLADQLAALGPSVKTAPRPPEPELASPSRPARKKPARRPKPRPGREALDQAEQALSALEAETRDSLAALRVRETALASERRELERRRAAARAKLSRQVEAQREKYEQAMARWREATD